MRNLILILLLSCLVVSSGCAPIVAHGLMTQSAIKSAAEVEFQLGLMGINSQREADGLPLLSVCEETARVNRKWALNLGGDCNCRIQRFEAGDTLAFDLPIEDLNCEDLPIGWFEKWKLEK